MSASEEAPTVGVRVIRTYEVEVEAAYGDTPESLVEKGLAALTATTGYAETAVLLDDDHRGGE